MVVRNEQEYAASAWRNNEFIFRNASLQSALEDIEQTYNVTIQKNFDINALETFTGTLVTNDLNGVLEVIEKSYGVKATLEHGVISFVKVK